MEGEGRGQAGHEQDAGAVARAGRDRRDAREVGAVEAQHRGDAQEAGLLRRDGEDEIGVARGQEAQLALRPLHVAAAGELPGAHRDLRLPHVVAGAQRVVGRGEEGQHALALVVLHAEVPDQRRGDERRDDRADQQARPHAGDQEHAGDHRREHRGTAQVRLDRGQQHRRRGDADHRQDLAVAQPALGQAREVAGDHQRRRELGELRRLQADAAQPEPAHRAAGLVADREHGRERDQADAVEHRREAEQALVVEAEDEQHAGQAERGPDDLAREVIGTGLGRGAAHDRQADQAERQRRGQHPPVDAGQVGQPRPPLRKRQASRDRRGSRAHGGRGRREPRPRTPCRRAR